MAGSGTTSLRTGLKKGLSQGGSGATELIPERVEKGFGTPTHVSPEGSIYVKLDATTMGTTSHYRMVSGTWTPMSDDE